MFLTKQLFVSSFAVRFEIMAVCSQLHLKFDQIYIVCLIIRPKIKISVRKIMTRTFMEWSMMTSSNGNIFRVTGHLCGKFPY